MPKVIGEATEMLKQTTCRNCAARLEYTNNEVSSRTGKDYDGSSFCVESIKCPRCGADVVVRSW